MATMLHFTSGGTFVIAWTIINTFIATVTVILRFWSRLLTKFSIGLDDWLVLTALITYYGIVVVTILAVKYGGLGYEETVVLEKAPEDLNYLLKMLFAYTFAYSISSQLIKLAVLAFYARIFPTRFIRTSSIVIGSISIAFMISMMLVNGLQCRPISYYWTQVGDATCIDLTEYYFVVSVINFIVDIITLVLPLREVWRLHATFWRRIGICCVFLVGSIVVVASLVRLVFMHQFEVNGLDNMTNDLVPGWVMTVIEVAVGIIGNCLPTLVPVYRKLRYGSVDAQRASHGREKSYQAGRSSRDIGSSGRGGRLAADGTGSFEMLSGPGHYDIAQQHTSVHANWMASHDDEWPLDAAPGIRVRHDVVWTETTQTMDTKNSRWDEATLRCA